MDRLSLINPKVIDWFDCWYLDAYHPASVFQIYGNLRYVTAETAGIYMQLAFCFTLVASQSYEIL